MNRRRLAWYFFLFADVMLLSGCFGKRNAWPSLSVQPYTIISGAPTALRPGWGGEAAWVVQFSHRLDEGYPFYGELVRLAWSHHEGKPGWPDAEYLRLGAAVGLVRLPIGVLSDEGHRWITGVGFLCGLSYHQILTDGPGDRGGLGLLLEPELQFFLRKRARLSLGCTAEGWVSTEGDLIGSLSPYLRIGFLF